MPEHFRLPVPLPKAYRLLNHGPTVLVSAAAGGKRNIMAAAWAMPLDFAPPKVAVVLDKSTWTRRLLEDSGEFVLQVPTVSQVDLTEALGSSSGLALMEQEGTDKFDAYGWAPLPARRSARRCWRAARPGWNAGCCRSRPRSRPTTCSLAKSCPRTRTRACSATGAGISTAMMRCAPSTMWLAGISWWMATPSTRARWRPARLAEQDCAGK